MPIGHYVLDDDGQPVPCSHTFTFAAWYANMDNRRLAYSDVPGGDVSTVFLAIDHAHEWREHVPVLWETLATWGDGNQYIERYETRSDALAGHDRIVANLRAGLKPDHVHKQNKQAPE